MKAINIDEWNRKEHYEFFSQLKSPFFGLTATINCTKAFNYAKANDVSFFAYYFHKSMTVVNSIKEFKYRIIDNAVYELDIINAGTTLAREDNTFAFSYIEYDEDFEIFNKNLLSEINEVKNSTGIRFNDDARKIDLIRHTTIPWLSFNAILHPNNHDNTDAIPKISFGKVYENNGEKLMPVSVEAHHGLMDGYHVCEYFRLFEELLNK
ncbi:chloramphenicol acetyltransferase [Flavobacterium sp. H122]|uniref:chloramphenicol acetyltransferase n=1 Tax=Flavobacterium sp. H122 TaxID=2529860 RepID=UPI0010AA9DD2|nr:chloramphenicol acetyltransferase [Flavobacterium sp. H122]